MNKQQILKLNNTQSVTTTSKVLQFVLVLDGGLNNALDSV